MPNPVFNTLSYGALFAAIYLLAASGYESYKHLVKNEEIQVFIFSGHNQANQVDPLDMLQSVVNQHIFGVVPPVLKKPEKIIKDIPVVETKLNLKLTGIIEGLREQHSFALIEIKPGSTVVIRQGDEIGKTGAVLYSIGNQYVTISRSDNLERLSITKPVFKNTSRTSSDELSEILGYRKGGETELVLDDSPVARPAIPNSSVVIESEIGENPDSAYRNLDDETRFELDEYEMILQNSSANK